MDVSGGGPGTRSCNMRVRVGLGSVRLVVAVAGIVLGWGCFLGRTEQRCQGNFD